MIKTENKIDSNYKIKPFVKWVGGKNQLLKRINIILEQQNFNRIIEPFVGGGAFFISQNKSFLINDINKELMISFEIIKNQPKELINLLDLYELKHSEEFFYNVRDLEWESMNKLDIASRFIYLNKACYNGMYRVNSKGKFNVPFGKKEKIKIYEEQNILNLSSFLKEFNSDILNTDYINFFEQNNFDYNDLIFIDPPYDKENLTSFTSYDSKGFNRNDQKKLFSIVRELADNGIKFILTNHNTSLINELYNTYDNPDFKLMKVNVNRMLNSDSKNRKNASIEVIVTNISLTKEQIERIEK